LESKQPAMARKKCALAGVGWIQYFENVFNGWALYTLLRQITQ
jgi:hypothetical protein